MLGVAEARLDDANLDETYRSPVDQHRAAVGEMKLLHLAAEDRLGDPATKLVRIGVRR